MNRKMIYASAALTVSVGMGYSTQVLAENADSGTAMYRLYNPNSGEHFYTASADEKANIEKVGWRYEGIGWYAPSKGNDVYRLYNPNSGDHHYTMSPIERNQLVSVGWRYEGIGWQSGGDTPLYRLYNPNAVTGTHHYTTSKSESDYLSKVGWNYENIAWYGLAAGESGEATDNKDDVNKSDKPQEQASIVDVNALYKGDFTTIADSWVNDLGEWVTITPNGQVYLHSSYATYSIQAQRLDKGSYVATLYNPKTNIGGAAFSVVPAGLADPLYGVTKDKDRLIIGQDSVYSNAHPYYRQKQ